jgi:hypothetical protein
MESFVRDEYRLPTIAAAIETLAAAKAGFIGFIYWLTRNSE